MQTRFDPSSAGNAEAVEWLELYQAEWCPHSRRVRQRLTELGVDFVARQVPAEADDRTALRERTGLDEIPVLVLAGGEIVAGERPILTELDTRFAEREDADAHRDKAVRLPSGQLR